MSAALATKKMAFIEVLKNRHGDTHCTHLWQINDNGRENQLKHNEYNHHTERNDDWELSKLVDFEGHIPDNAIRNIPKELIGDALIATPIYRPLASDPIILFPLNDDYCVGFWKW